MIPFMHQARACILLFLSLATLPAHGIMIDLRLGDMSGSQQNSFVQAADYWGNVLIGYQSNIVITDPIIINADIEYIDGVNGVLGSAGPTWIYSDVNGFTLTAEGDMRFDSSDIASLESNNMFDDVILHEMAHVLGLGTLWQANNVYVPGSGQYTGAYALAQWQIEFNQPGATFVPVELDGGQGTAGGHWNENLGGGGATGIVDLNGNDIAFELMTGWLNSPSYISDTTLMSFADIGYQVAPIPLPAAGYLLFSALAGLSIFKKRLPHHSE